MIYENMQQAVGNTPYLRVDAPEVPNARIHVKLEGLNPTGSVKDRAGLRIIRDAIADGSLHPGDTLIDASSGNMACTIAYFGRVLGYPTTVVVSSKLTEDKRNFLRYYGAEIHQVGDFTVEGNHWCREHVSRTGGERYCFLDQLHNWANPRDHYESTGPEILSAFPEVELVVASLGSGGTLYGTGSYLKEHSPGTKVVAVESASGTRLPGTGSFTDGDYVTPFIRKGREQHVFDDAVRITYSAAVSRTLQLRDQGVFCGLQTGGVFHAVLETVRDLDVRGDVVVISGDAGWKNVDKLLPHVTDEVQ